MALADLERRAWTSQFQDGLMDIVFGVMLTNMGVAALATDLHFDFGGFDTLVTIGVSAVAVTGFLLGKRFITKPRLGTARFSKKRRSKFLGAVVALTVSVALGLVAWGAATTGFDMSLVPWLFLVNALVVFGAMAWFLDVPRFAVYGLLFGVPAPVGAVMYETGHPGSWEAIGFGAGGVVIVAVGVALFVRFLRDNPLIGPGLDEGDAT